MSKFVDDIRDAISMENIRNAMRTAARDVLPDAADRIFTKGLDSDNADIGQYSTNPIYISKKNSPRNAGRDTGKSLFFPGGYKEFKEAIGRGSRVNLKLFGRLQSDYLSSKEINTPLGIKYDLKEQDNIDKKEWSEEHFGKDIFSLTTAEEQTVQRVFQFELIRRINR